MFSEETAASQASQSLLVLPSPECEPGEALPEREARRGAEGRLRYKKLKQRLNLLSEQVQDQGLLKDPRDIASPNKSRLMKLALELEKALRTQAIEYPLLESLLREIAKILEHRREHDLLILRGARLLGTLSAIVRRFPSLHKNEAAQSLPALDASLKLLRIMLALASSREALIVGNQMPAVSSLLSCALMREERRTAVSCLHLLNQLLAGPNRVEIHPLLAANAEYILCSSLLKRLRTALEAAAEEDDPAGAEFLLLGFRFYHSLLSFSCSRDHPRPIYAPLLAPDSLAEAVSGYFESALQMLVQSTVALVFEGDEGEERCLPREYELPNFKIGVLLFIFKSLNAIFSAGVALAQQLLPASPAFLAALRFVLEVAKEGFQESAEAKSLCSEVIVFIGCIAFENAESQQAARASGLLEAVCNHPLEYLMEPVLRHVLVPTVCCLIHQNPRNFALAFAENSVHPILNYVEKEMVLWGGQAEEEEPLDSGKLVHCRTHSRKTSVSSINSSYSKASIGDAFPTLAPAPGLAHRFRPEYWEELVQELRKIDD